MDHEAPLRHAVLAGRFFSAGHRAEAERLATFNAVSGAATLRTWFGDTALRRLAATPDGLRGALDRDIAAIDALIGAQLDAILHAPRLARLEGSWRGLFWLVDGFDPGNRIKVKVLSAAWSEICRDLERAAEFDQSHLFRKIYEDEFGMPGGEPYGLLVVDHEVRHRPGPGAPTDDVTALKLLAAVAAAAFVPTVLAAAPTLLEVDGFTDLAGVADPAAPLRTADYARWRGLFSLEDIRFLAVTLPRMLARPPWLDDPARHDGFRYEEFAPDVAARIWSNAGYGFAATVVRAFANFAWPADVRGVETDRRAGGLVDDLALEPFRTDAGQAWVRPSLEVVLTDRQERILVDAGLMPLSAIPFSEDAVFGAVRSLQTPAQYTGPTAAAANANARLSTQINTLLCVSRFAHYVKMLGRGMVGSFRTGDEIERQLQSWLSGFVNSNVTSGSDTRAKYPLIAGRVTVRERPGRPGVFGCVVQLQPYFQLDDVAASFRLTTDIVAPGASLR
ncbi:MAG: type VI secretion protein [Rhodospirillales bacterium 70-18]|nr:type VI secretion system contractile sheath large subunit [Rhodospirillales bacterium]OJY64106.1 MAG: type VI secretion protein [Rhodospirillales bacterium 70-18]